MSEVKIDRDRLLELVKQAICEIEADAEIMLFGSRARGDAGSESDWDFLVLLNGVVDDNRIDEIRHRLYEIEWDCGEVLSCIVRNRQEWQTPMYRSTPFHRIVESEGILL